MSFSGQIYTLPGAEPTIMFHLCLWNSSRIWEQLDKRILEPWLKQPVAIEHINTE